MRGVLIIMSRIGKNPIPIPESVSVDLNRQVISASGPKGSQEFTAHQDMNITTNDGLVTVERPSDIREHRALHGTTRQMINNLLVGVSEGFVKELEIIGVGYQATIQGSRLKLQLGFSHDIYFDLPEGSQGESCFKLGQTVEVLKSFVESEFGIPMELQVMYLNDSPMMNPLSLLDFSEAKGAEEIFIRVDGPMNDNTCKK